ncbi:MAG: YolD-like family protein [Desulfovibrionaceae bacterium]|nr:YolD-like family protein [Desulfovibrionaceae bacterium]
MTGKYDDIINLPHHVSTKHPQMSMMERAAQFSPFAALTGHGNAIEETARVTMERIELDEQAKEDISRNLQRMLEGNVEGVITYFIPDPRKDGGSYATLTGYAVKIDEVKNILTMKDGTAIPVADILECSII